MFKVKPYVILVTLVGILLLIYGMTFLSTQFFPVTDNSSQLMITLTISIISFGVMMALAAGGMFLYIKKNFEDNQPKH